MQQSLEATQADTELLSARLGCGARPVQLDHALKIFRGEAIRQTPRTDYHVAGVDLRIRACLTVSTGI